MKQKLHMRVDATKSPDAIFSTICDMFEAVKKEAKASVAAAQK